VDRRLRFPDPSGTSATPPASTKALAGRERAARLANELAHLDSEAAVAAYLTGVIDANDASLLAAALGDIARARGMTEIARSAGISAPRFGTVRRVCASLGVRLVVQPAHP